MSEYTFTATATGSTTGSGSMSAGFSVASLPVVGLDKTAWSSASAAIGPLAAIRSYNTPGQGIPASWPGPGAGSIPAGVTLPIISIKPDLAKFQSGSLDAALAAYAKQVPAGAWVTCWHEGERANEGNASDLILALHEWAYPIFKANSPECLYGQIFTTFSATNNRITNWTLPGLDYYGLDGYQISRETPAVNFNAAVDMITAVEPSPTLAVTETNAPVVANRPAWFEAAWQWAIANNCLAYLPYYDATSNTSSGYGWLPGDTATIAALNSIAAGNV